MRCEADLGLGYRLPVPATSHGVSYRGKPWGAQILQTTPMAELSHSFRGVAIEHHDVMNARFQCPGARVCTDFHSRVSDVGVSLCVPTYQGRTSPAESWQVREEPGSLSNSRSLDQPLSPVSHAPLFDEDHF